MQPNAPLSGSEPAEDQQSGALAILARLNQVAAQINAFPGHDATGASRLWRSLAESVAVLIPGASAALTAYDVAHQALARAVYAAAGEAWAANADVWPAALGMTAVRRGQSVLAFEDPALMQPPLPSAARVEALGAFPWSLAGEPDGVLFVGLAGRPRFTPLELSICENLAGQAAAAAYRLADAACGQQVVGETFAAMDELAANLLHHINNKVGTIPVRVEGIQDKCAALLPANPYLAGNLTQIGQSARDALAALREGLAILKPVNGGVASPDVCVAQAVAAAQLPPDVVVQVQDLADLPPIYGGADSLGPVLISLLQNVAAGGAANTIIIRGAAREGYVELAIHDPGPGTAGAGVRPAVPPGEVVDPESERGDLWWARMALVRLGGSIVVENSPSGQVFRLRVPAVGEQHDRG